jgi:hypothetical protein
MYSLILRSLCLGGLVVLPTLIAFAQTASKPTLVVYSVKRPPGRTFLASAFRISRKCVERRGQIFHYCAIMAYSQADCRNNRYHWRDNYIRDKRNRDLAMD